jgi:hypothetical protein
MHCELAVPGLFAGAAQAPAPALELLLARGRPSARQSLSLEAWLADAFGLDARLPAGALTLLAGGADPGSACWVRADPVHLRLARERLIVVPDAAFPLSAEEAAALVEALNRHFAGVLALHAVEARRWCAQLGEDLALDAPSAIECAGRDVDLTGRIGGEAGKRWSALLTEAQMLLHAHPVNQAREERGEPAVNSLWLWGAGRVPATLKASWQSIAAGDPLVLGLAKAAHTRSCALPAGAEAWLAQASPEGRHLAVLDALRAPLVLGQAAEYRECIDALERQWFAPLLGALRGGSVGMVTLHVPDAGACFETIRGDLRRIWRRRRPLEHYA